MRMWKWWRGEISAHDNSLTDLCGEPKEASHMAQRCPSADQPAPPANLLTINSSFIELCLELNLYGCI